MTGGKGSVRSRFNVRDVVNAMVRGKNADDTNRSAKIATQDLDGCVYMPCCFPTNRPTCPRSSRGIEQILGREANVPLVGSEWERGKAKVHTLGIEEITGTFNPPINAANCSVAVHNLVPDNSHNTATASQSESGTSLSFDPAPPPSYAVLTAWLPKKIQLQ